jgi:cysteine-rich repeat protein
MASRVRNAAASSVRRDSTPTVPATFRRTHASHPRCGAAFSVGMRTACERVASPQRFPHLLRAALLATALAVASAARATAPPFPRITTQTFPGPDVEVPIPDGSSLISMMTLDLEGQMVVDVDVVVAISHPNPSDLNIYLVSPGGTTVSLSTGNGGGNDDVFNGTTFDDQATGTPSAPNARNFPYANLVATGPIQPEEPLGAVFGETANGPWGLVILDRNNNGSAGTLHSWSLVMTTLPMGSLTPSAPVDFAATDASGAAFPATIPDNNTSGLVSTVAVSGVGKYLYDVDVTTDIQHNRSSDLDLFLTAPSGRRIDLVTAFGGGNVDLYRGTVWDDQAGVPIADAPLPTSPNHIVRTPGEGALSDFLGDDPNGTWTLTVVDHAGGTVGKLNGWSLRIVTAAICGDGTVDPGEQCDDGNLVDGDGCDSNCTPTACGNGVKDPTEDCDDGNTLDGDGCPASCHFSEKNCGDCKDDDANGKLDAFDPACNAASFTLAKASLATLGNQTKLSFSGTGAPTGALSGTASFALADSTGALGCAVVGPLQKHGKKMIARTKVAGVPLTLTVANGKVSVKGTISGGRVMDDAQLAVGVTLGSQAIVGGGAVRQNGTRKVFP